MKRIVGLLYVIVAFVIIYLCVLIPKTDTYSNSTVLNKKSSLYLWNLNDIDYSGFSSLVEYLNIDTIYVGSYGNFNSYKHNLYFNFASKENLKSYIVYGEKYEDQDIILNEVKDLIDDIYNYNISSDYKISGITIDSEFHATDAYRNASLDERIEIFRKYIDIMKESYNYAKEKNLEFVLCIPWNYDKNISIDMLDELIKDACDYVQIMNYTKNNSIVNIENEVNIAKKYNKRIESIAELQMPGEHGIIDATTFWSDGIDACTNKFAEIDAYYNYENLYYTYHQLKPMMTLYKDIKNIDNLYDLEITPKDIDGTNLKLSVSLFNDNETISGLNIYDPRDNLNKVYFYGLSFNNEYKIKVNNSNYETDFIINKEINEVKIIKEDVILNEYVIIDDNESDDVTFDEDINNNIPDEEVNKVENVEVYTPIINETLESNISYDITYGVNEIVDTINEVYDKVSLELKRHTKETDIDTNISDIVVEEEKVITTTKLNKKEVKEIKDKNNKYVIYVSLLTIVLLLIVIITKKQ